MDPKEMLAKRLLKMASEILAAEDEEAEDPAFVQKIRTLKTSLPKLTRLKNKKLNQLGISRPAASATIEDLVDALTSAISAG